MKKDLRRLFIFVAAAVGILASIATSMPWEFQELTVMGPVVSLGATESRTYELVVCSAMPYEGEVRNRIRAKEAVPQLLLTARTLSGSAGMEVAGRETVLSPDRTTLQQGFKILARQEGKFCSDTIEVTFRARGDSVEIEWEIDLKVYVNDEEDSTERRLTVEVRER